MKLTRLLPLLGVVLFAAGCAVSPQQVAVEPSTDESFLSAASSGISVNVLVRDDRDTAVLGSLGGTYSDSSMLTTSNNVTGDIQAMLEEKLTAAGYEVVNEDARFHLRVDLRQLSYERDTSGVGSEVRVVSDLLMRVEEGSAYFENTYIERQNQSRATRPTAEDNKMFVEETLNASLDRLVRSERLNDFLAR